jgi:hypothetical protein
MNSEDHKELVKDAFRVFINFTALPGFIELYKVSKKWIKHF